MLIANKWKDFELLEAGNGEKLERWGSYILRRPDGQIIWPNLKESYQWNHPDAWYHRSNTGGGQWEFLKRLPSKWVINYGSLSFYVEPTGFKHTGIFPEQAVNWDWIMDVVGRAKKEGRQVRVLNLFAYTGGATVAAAAAGAEVCHVDASKGMVTRARENLELSGLKDRPVRWIVDDVMKFVQREGRRQKQYDAIIMDPPSYGRGPKGELWEVEKELYNLVDACVQILSPNPLFFLINCYTTDFSSIALENILNLSITERYGGTVRSGELGLPITRQKMVLPCGIFGRWEARG